MHAEDWSEIEEVFLEAAELAPSERTAYLDRVCAGRPHLRQEVESLLKADTASDSGIVEAIGSEVHSLLDEESAFPGSRIGAYRIERLIGRGGMGFVYLGERDDEHYRKLVAIKVVRRGMDSAEVLARFRHERQVLATLEHPYIARLIDGGSTKDGQPFFVMEYVEGQSIDEYCRTHNLTTEARLRIFVRVCEAVAYAHGALVVHRDLKPSNILVTAEGIPKLLDFGVSKMLDARSDPGLTSSWSSMGPLTPEYASPEQVLGLPITTAADVYALGTILFELLTGRRAQKMAGHSMSEIERVVCRETTPSPRAVAKAAGIRLGSELDTIVLMAMRKEPERRYRSVVEFMQDVQRYLRGQPILARQDSVAYRAQKFFQRHRLVASAAALIAASLLGGTAIALRQAHQAENARRIAESQKQSAEFERVRAEEQTRIAERERARAEAETQFAKIEQERAQRRLTQILDLADRSLFDVHSEIEKLPGATAARRKIVATTLAYLETLSKDAEQDDRLRFMLSVSYMRVADVLGYPLQPNLGDSKGALVNYEKSDQFVAPLLQKEPNRPEYVLQYIENRADWTVVLERSGSVPRAIEMLNGLISKARRLVRLCPEKPECWTAEESVDSELVNIYLTSDANQALHYSQLETQSLERARDAFPKDMRIQTELATAYSQQARVRNRHGELKEAADLYRQAVALREEALKNNPSDVLLRRNLMITYGNLGGNLGNPLFPNLGDSAGAVEFYGKALAIARDLAQSDKNDQLAQYDLANALLYSACLDIPKEGWSESLARLQEAETILRALIAADPISVPRVRALALVLEYEGRRLDGLGHPADAITRFRASLGVIEKLASQNPTDLTFTTQALASQEALAEMLARQGNHDAALDEVRKAVRRAEGVTVTTAERDRAVRYVAVAYQSLATVEATLGEWDKARTAAERALSGWKQLTDSSSRLAEPERIASAQALLQDCLGHLQK